VACRKRPLYFPPKAAYKNREQPAVAPGVEALVEGAMRLTARKVATLKGTGRYGDGHGLYLQVMPGGVKSWLFRYERHGKERAMGLGPIHTVSLADARDRARRARLQLLDGLDPIEARKAQRAAAALEAAKSMTFEAAAKEFVQQHEARWSSRKVQRQVASQLAKYVYATVGKLPVASIDRALVLRVLEQRHPDHDGQTLWHAIPETANRLRGRLEEILAWADVRGLRSGTNPAAWRGNLEHALPAPSTIAKAANHASLPYPELPAFMMALHPREGVSAKALEFLILCASRANEVLGAKWSEIDFDGRTWTVPAARMKMKREHHVPPTAHHRVSVAP
jgi:hypothetical protein